MAIRANMNWSDKDRPAWPHNHLMCGENLSLDNNPAVWEISVLSVTESQIILFSPEARFFQLLDVHQHHHSLSVGVCIEANQSVARLNECLCPGSELWLLRAQRQALDNFSAPPLPVFYTFIITDPGQIFGCGQSCQQLPLCSFSSFHHIHDNKWIAFCLHLNTPLRCNIGVKLVMRMDKEWLVKLVGLNIMGCVLEITKWLG